MELVARKELETLIDRALKDMQAAKRKKNLVEVVNWWRKAILYASILRTEIDNAGTEYIDQKEESSRKVLGVTRDAKEEIYLCLQKIILAKQDRDVIAFKYWYARLEALTSQEEAKELYTHAQKQKAE